MKTIRLIAIMSIVFISINLNAQSLKSRTNSEKKGNPVNLPQPKPAPEIGKVTATIAYILQDKITICDKKYQLTDTPEDLTVMDDRIEFKIKKENAVIYFADILNSVIAPPYPRKGKIILSLERFEFITNGFNSNLKRLEDLRDNLILMQTYHKTQRDESQRILFEQKSSAYRALKVKPPVSEEQRKFIVQANLFNQQKNYTKAIELYTQAIELDQTAYPAGYSNLALLLAQINNFSAAIDNMKKYLLLEPEASDARSGQDKIYEWEAMIQK